MALTTYTELKEAILDYLGRTDLSDRVPTFVALAESRMNRTLRLRVMEHRAYCTVLAGNSEVPLPTKRVKGDWDVFLDMRDLVWTPMAGGKSKNIYYATPDLYAVEKERSGMPSHFTIAAGNDLFLLPTPDHNGTLQLSYYAEVPPLCEEQPDNEILLTAPDLYLYGSLVESAPWTRGSAPVEMWQQYLKEAVRNVTRSEQSARYPTNMTCKPCRRIK